MCYCTATLQLVEALTKSFAELRKFPRVTARQGDSIALLSGDYDGLQLHCQRAQGLERSRPLLQRQPQVPSPHRMERGYPSARVNGFLRALREPAPGR